MGNGGCRLRLISLYRSPYNIPLRFLIEIPPLRVTNDLVTSLFRMTYVTTMGRYKGITGTISDWFGWYIWSDGHWTHNRIMMKWFGWYVDIWNTSFRRNFTNVRMKKKIQNSSFKWNYIKQYASSKKTMILRRNIRNID